MLVGFLDGREGVEEMESPIIGVEGVILMRKVAKSGGPFRCVLVEHEVRRIAESNGLVVDPAFRVLVLNPYLEFLGHPFTDVGLWVVDPYKLKTLDPLKTFFRRACLFALQCQEGIDWHLHGRDRAEHVKLIL